jgi:hypothetical protein
VKLHASLNQVSQLGKWSELLVKKTPTGRPTLGYVVCTCVVNSVSAKG